MDLNPQVKVATVGECPSLLSAYLPIHGCSSLSDASEGSVTIKELSALVPDQTYSLESHEAFIQTDSHTGLVLVSVPFPTILDTGVYRFRLEAVVGTHAYQSDVMCIVSPQTCYQPTCLESGHRIAGIALALYGVRSAINWGVGDFGDLRKIVEWAHDDLRLDFIGLNPLHALFNRRPFNNSPYLPSSRLYKNYLYLDIPGIEDFSASPGAQLLVDSPQTQSLILRLRSEEYVNYEEVADLKLRVLRELFCTFLETYYRSPKDDCRSKAFDGYTSAQGVHLARYATFCALQEHFQEQLPTAVTWRQWPLEFLDPSGPAVKAFQIDHHEKILFWMYVQWQIDAQLESVQEYAIQKGMTLGLYHDQALAVDTNGADFWGWKDFFHEGFSIGAPPDDFAPQGQDWGFAPPNREAMRDSGFDLFAKNLEANCRHVGALRIDHIMQLNHLFWIPRGKKPSDGVYVQDYETELLAVLCLESQHSRTVIIGEDLGTVPFQFRERLMQKGIFSYRLFYFERDQWENQRPFTEYPQHALVSISTHDLPTLAGFWSYSDIDSRVDMGLIPAERVVASREERTRHRAKIIERLFNDGFLDGQNAHAAWESTHPTDELHTAVMSFILHTPSQLALINQEDLFLDIRQQNFPGTTHEHPNWVTKMRFSVEELRTDPEAIRMARKLRTLVEESGRISR